MSAKVSSRRSISASVMTSGEHIARADVPTGRTMTPAPTKDPDASISGRPGRCDRMAGVREAGACQTHPVDVMLPLTFEECRTRFRRAALNADLRVTAHPIAAGGPHGLELTIDVVQLGDPAPDRTLVVVSGVHGVEGFIGSALQCDLLARWDPDRWPRGLGVLVVHAVNPWGMAWSRRQNESNVDLNRNWQRSSLDPPRNAAYEELHALACPDTPELPAVEQMIVTAQDWVTERGLAWVRDGITTGQYTHPDGLHYGGAVTEESNRILEALVPAMLGSAARVFTVDLHTGHGPRGALTALCDQPPGSDQERFLNTVFDRVEATTGNPTATTAPKVGQIGNGIAQVLPHATAYATSLEFGTTDDLTQLGATYQEQWVHRHGDRERADHSAAVWAYRCCFTPEEPDWASDAFTGGRAALDRALAAVEAWT